MTRSKASSSWWGSPVPWLSSALVPSVLQSCGWSTERSLMTLPLRERIARQAADLRRERDNIFANQTCPVSSRYKRGSNSTKSRNIPNSLGSRCRYPYGGDRDGEAITFCGHPRLAGSRYCAPHCRLTRDDGTAADRAVAAVVLRLVEAA
jgi:hypothetical protein